MFSRTNRVRGLCSTVTIATRTMFAQRESSSSKGDDGVCDREGKRGRVCVCVCVCVCERERGEERNRERERKTERKVSLRETFVQFLCLGRQLRG
jgi:hypothetical protein